MEKHDFVEMWAIHSERDAQPVLRGWAASQAEATARMERLRADDPEAAKTEYWVMQLTRGELATLKQAGVIPAEA